MKPRPSFRLFVPFFTLAFAGTVLRSAEPAQPASFGGATPMQWSVRMADAEIARRDDTLAAREGSRAKLDYTMGLFTLSLVKLSGALSEPRFEKYAETTVGSFISPDGAVKGFKIDENSLDNINGGKTVLALYSVTKEERYRKAAAELRAQFRQQHRTSEGGFWHKDRYPHQMWLDGLYMGAPFYAACAREFQEPVASFDDIATQFRVIAAHTYDPKTGLFFHGWDESRKQSWANPETGTSPCFWSRAIGWYAMAIVDTLDFFPADHPARAELVKDLQRVCAGVVRHQEPESGLWYQVTDQGGRKGNYLEATGSAMFVYTMAKGINRGYLSRDFAAPALKGYAGIVGRLLKTDARGQVTLTQCCQVAGLGYGRDGTYEYYLREPIVDNDLKGVGPFILAGIELQQLLGLPASAEGPAGAAQPARPVAAEAPEWEGAKAVLARIKEPVFPAREFPITDFGAVADGRTDSTEAIRKAIDACSAAGGGHVLVSSPGVFLTGAIHLKSNVDLHVGEGSTLQFIADPEKYLPAVFTRWEGVECFNYSPFIYAFEQENIAVTGSGTLDGGASAENWWKWTKKDGMGASSRADRGKLFDMGERGVPVAERVFGAGHYLRPNFIQPYRCRNVLISGVRLRRSPMWEINPVLCTNVIVRGVDIVSSGPNNDGCDPEACRDVLIEDCQFTTGDDCIAIKSGRNNDGRRVGRPSENLVIRRCTMRDGHGGVTIGSEISGGCRNVYVEDCSMDSPELDRAFRFKSNARRGGVLENFFMRNVVIGQVGEAVLTVDFMYEEGPKGDFRPELRHIVLRNITSRASPRVMYIAGFPGATIDDIRFYGCAFRGLRSAEVLQSAGTVSFHEVTFEPASKGRSLNSPNPQ